MKKQDENITIIVGVILLFLISCIICYIAGHKTAEAEEVKGLKSAKTTTVVGRVGKPMANLVATTTQVDQEVADESSSQEDLTMATPVGSWTGTPGVEQWRGLVAEIWGVNPTDHLVDEVLQVMDGESRGDPNAYNPGGPYVGLMQYGADDFWTVERLMDPRENLNAAYIMWQQDRWGPWECKPSCGGCY